ncbi:MAG: hypothetical protein LBR38_07255 [Synergistaceae bacterium]|jgi:hypothetical protein|nr:hypothetical protein [Synergistaceae bacterium]
MATQARTWLQTGKPYTTGFALLKTAGVKTAASLTRINNIRLGNARFFARAQVWALKGALSLLTRFMIQKELRRYRAEFRKFGIDLTYPMLKLAEQCRALGDDTGRALIAFIDASLENDVSSLERCFSVPMEQIKGNHARAVKLRQYFRDALDQIDYDIIEPLTDVRTALSFLYGPERDEIEALDAEFAAKLAKWTQKFQSF